MEKQIFRLLLCNLISLALHLGFFKVFAGSHFKIHESSASKKISRIQIVHASARSSTALNNKSKGKGKHWVKQYPKDFEGEKTVRHRNSKNDEKIQDSLAYKNLLPKTGDIGFYSTGRKATHPEYSGKRKAEISAVAGDLVSEVSMPLAFRREFDFGRASAKVSSGDGGSMTLKELKGSPVLRAVLYDILLETKNSSKLLAELGSLFQSQLFEISIEVSASAEPYTSEFQYSIKVFENKILLEVIKHLKFPVYGGGNLPDEHAERANLRDRAEFSRLIESPAYRASLRDYPIRSN